MKKQFKYTPLALAVAALIASPLAFADRDYQDSVSTSKTSEETNSDHDSTSTTSSVYVDIYKDFNYDEDVYIDVDVDGDDLATGENSYARALINDTQSNDHNKGYNGTGYYDKHGDWHPATGHNNNASASGGSLSGASGNIGLNITGGDNNQQDNSAALAVADAEMTFGVADAQAHSSQDGELNKTYNVGVTNNAGAFDNALQNATGNIGVNISAGNNNQQKNNMAVATSTGGVGMAMVTTDQESDHNRTRNVGSVVTLTKSGELSGSVNLSGRYEGGGSGTYNGGSTGTADQIGNVYPDIWTGPSHPSGSADGHFDLDTDTQGGSDLNDDGGALAFNTESTDSGSLGFTESGDIGLSGTFSGSFSASWDVYLPSANNALLAGNALQGAAGNIGVNVASGTGNQQVNSLSMTSSTGTGMGTPGGSE